MTNAEEFVRAFLKAIENDEVIGKERDWYTEGAVQVEWPNKLLPSGAVRTVEDLREAGERGRAIVDRQWYEVTNILVGGNKVAVEAVFRATFKIDVAGLSKGDEMVAHFAMFFEMRDGRIARHHTYDCFDHW